MLTAKEVQEWIDVVNLQGKAGFCEQHHPHDCKCVWKDFDRLTRTCIDLFRRLEKV